MSDFCTIPEIAEQLRVDQVTVRRWIRAGKLPAFRIGGVYRVSTDDFEEFMRSQRVIQ